MIGTRGIRGTLAGVLGAWLVSNAPAATWYVDGPNCSPPTNGSAGDPFCNIQDGIDAASDGDEIRVAAGTYSEFVEFWRLVGQQYVGVGAHVIGVSGPENTTIVSPSGTSKPVVEFNCFNYTCNANATLEGFTVTGGGFSGIKMLYAAPTIKSCKIVGNGGTSGTGGGIQVNDSSPVIEDTTICRNSASSGGGIGLLGTDNDLTLRRCRIEGNRSYAVIEGGGGGLGMIFAEGVLTIEDSIIAQNMTGNIGGGIYINGSISVAGENCAEPVWDLTISGSLLFGNVAARGGALALDDGTQSSIINTTFSANAAIGASIVQDVGTGGALWVSNECTQEIVNSILWGDMSQRGEGMEITVVNAGDVELSYSVLMGGEDGVYYVNTSDTVDCGTGCITDDPLFCDPAVNDFHLDEESPAINAGNNSAVAGSYDLDGNDRIYDDSVDIVDMGAYEDQGTGCTGAGIDPACPCDYASIESSDPADGTIDRRQPHPLNDNTLDARQGFGSLNFYNGGYHPIIITLDESFQTDLSCWSLCETGIEPVQSGSDPLLPNRVVNVVGLPNGVHEVYLARPVSAKHWTTITFEGSGDSVSVGSHPANCNGDSWVNTTDLGYLNALHQSGNCTASPEYIWDMNRDESCTYDDVEHAWDMMTGEGKYYAFMDVVPFPSNSCLSQQAMMGGSSGLTLYEGITGGLIDYLMSVPRGDHAKAAHAVEVSSVVVERAVQLLDKSDLVNLADELIFAESRCDNKSVAKHIGKLLEQLGV